MDLNVSDDTNTQQSFHVESNLNNETSPDLIDSNFCTSPVAEIEEPLSPVLTTSKKSVKHIARRKSRIKLQNKFSQSSLSSQQDFSSLETQSTLEENDNILTENSDVSVAEKQLIKEDNKNNELEKRMKKCLEMQKNKKFCYDFVISSSNEIENENSNTSMNYNTEVPSEISNSLEGTKSFISNINVVENKENDFNFKVPVSPVLLSKGKQCKTENLPSLQPSFDLNIAFETGNGKKIYLSEKAVIRASKLFDDIVHIPSVTSKDVKEVNNTENSLINNSNMSLKKVNSLFDDIYDLSNYKDIEKSDNIIESNNISTENNIKNKFNEDISPHNKNTFTQITDTQMCWAAENAECLAEFMNSQWAPSPKGKSQNHKNTQKTIDGIDKSQSGFENFLSPEGEQFFGNLTICEDGTLTSRNKIDENAKTQNLFQDCEEKNTNSMNEDNEIRESIPAFEFCSSFEEKLTDSQNKNVNNTENHVLSVDIIINSNDNNIRLDTSSNEQEMPSKISEQILSNEKNIFEEQLAFDSNNCCGFTWDDSLKSLKILELYKRSFKYIENNMKKRIFYPLSYTFSNVSSSKDYKNKKYKYVFRGRKKSDFVYTYGGIKYKRISKKLSVSQEPKYTRSRRSMNNEYNDQIRHQTMDNDDNFSLSNESNKISSGSTTPDINVKSIKDLEDAFLSSIESSVNSADICLFTEGVNKNEHDNTERSLEINLTTKNNKIIVNSQDVDYTSKQEIGNIGNFCNSTAVDKFLQDCNNVEKNTNNTLSMNLDSTLNISNTGREAGKTNISEENIIKIRKKFSSSDMLGGFSTASGKKVNISKESLQKAKTLFEDCSKFEEPDKSNNCSSSDVFDDKNGVLEKINVQNNSYNESESNLKFSFSTSAGKSIEVSEENLNKARKKLLESEITPSFSTASGKNIEIKEESLQQAKMLFQDCNSIKEEEYKAVDNNCSLNEMFDDKNEIFEEKLDFLTGPEKTITVSERNLDSDLAIGFSTASGKQVSISEESLQKARMLFQDYNNTKEQDDKEVDNNCSLNEMFDDKNEISEENKEQKNVSVHKLDVLTGVQNKTTASERNLDSDLIIGFSTAGGKQVRISEESLQKAKMLFQDYSTDELDKNSETGNICFSNEVSEEIKNEKFGFSTAAGKTITVSEENLNKARNLFLDADMTAGFSTAGGKKVEISEESLQKAKILFQDCNNIKELDKNNIDLNSPKNEFKSDFDIKKIIKNEDFGFSTAGGKKVEISQKSLEKAKQMFEEFDNAESNVDNLSKENYEVKNTFKNIDAPVGFSTASCKKVNISEKSLEKAKLILEDCNTSVEFQDNNLKSESNIYKSRKILQDTNIVCGFSTASGKNVDISEISLKKAKEFFQDCNNSEQDNINIESQENNTVYQNSNTAFGFSTASGHKVNISEESVQKAKMIFQDSNDIQELQNSSPSVLATGGFSTASGKTVIISEEALNQARNKLESITDISDSTDNQIDSFKQAVVIKNNIEDVNKNTKSELVNKNKSSPAISANKSYSSPQISTFNTTPVMRNRTVSARSSKKRSLGVNSCKQLNVSESSIKKAKLIFDDVDTPKKKDTILNNNHINYSPLSSKLNTPIVQNLVLKATPKTTPNKTLIDTTVTMKESNQIKSMQNLSTLKISPQKNICILNETTKNNSSVVFQNKTGGDFKKWSSDIEKEIQMLQLKLNVNKTRLDMLKSQEEIIKTGSLDHRRQRPGYLFTQKTNNTHRISLKTAVNNCRPKKTQQICLNMGLNPSLLEVNPENSSSVHFLVPWWPNDNRTYPAVLRTDDGAIVIPNAQNYIGITEIENAFLAMPGVDPTLISKKWVSNHYRWIVWKLVSMERNYPDIFENYFSVENILNQLKYRYDREIDRAQRPAIRKIVECDDTAAKRMVLCVANVIKLSENKHELELTDGWYSIKTSIDLPLNSLVEKNVIKVGMKLMIQGADLLNCEGCCPLEIPSNVRLQIHYNSTRRAAWYAKLGYQPNPGPLRISLRMIEGNGGPVGGVCAYIARVYPVSFMERCDANITWRNQRAELRRANQWEASYANSMEILQMRVQQELELEWLEKNKIKNKKSKLKDVKDIYCGRTLYQFMEESNDPDSLKELLTPTQISALQNYQSELSMERQAELTSRLRQKLSAEKLQPRNVTPVLKLVLVDVQSTYHHRMFRIWKPTESHTQLLKEGIVMNIHNVAVKNNGTLSSIPRTQFEQVFDYDQTKFESLNRFVLPIYQTMNPNLRPQFGEFDTIGMVVRIDIKQITQYIWLVDEKQRFLLIKIRDGIESCSLFDGISPGKVVAVLNLIYQKPNKSYGEAFANCYSVISSYPQQLYLQEFMHEFIENLPKNVDQYLEESIMLVEEFSSSTSLNLKHGYVLNPENNCEIDSDVLVKKLCGMENIQESKCESLTLSDEEMALIDTQLL